MSIAINDNPRPSLYLKLVAPVQPVLRSPNAHGERRGHPDLSQHSNKRGRRSAGPVHEASMGDGKPNQVKVVYPQAGSGTSCRFESCLVSLLADPCGGSCGPDHVGCRVDMWL